LRVDAVEDVADDPILPTGIHSLQYDQQLLLAFCIEQLLQFLQPRSELLQLLLAFGLIAIETAGVTSITCIQVHAGPWLDAVDLHIPSCP